METVHVFGLTQDEVAESYLMGAVRGLSEASTENHSLAIELARQGSQLQYDRVKVYACRKSMPSGMKLAAQFPPYYYFIVMNEAAKKMVDEYGIVLRYLGTVETESIEGFETLLVRTKRWYVSVS